MIIDDYFKEMKNRIKIVQDEIEREKIGFVREQEFRDNDVVIMNETDFLEPEESGQPPVDMFDLDKEDNVRRRDEIIEMNQKYEKIMSILAGKSRSI